MRPWGEWLLKLMEMNGDKPSVTSVVRSSTKQAWLYDRYLRGLSKYPVAPPGRSLHEAGRAFDVVIPQMDRLRLYGAVWRRVGGRWYESDPIHFEA